MPTRHRRMKFSLTGKFKCTDGCLIGGWVNLEFYCRRRSAAARSAVFGRIGAGQCKKNNMSRALRRDQSLPGSGDRARFHAEPRHHTVGQGAHRDYPVNN